MEAGARADIIRRVYAWGDWASNQSAPSSPATPPPLLAVLVLAALAGAAFALDSATKGAGLAVGCIGVTDATADVGAGCARLLGGGPFGLGVAERFASAGGLAGGASSRNAQSLLLYEATSLMGASSSSDAGSSVASGAEFPLTGTEGAGGALGSAARPVTGGGA